MVAAGKLENLVPSGIATRESDCAHGRLGTGTDHSDHLYGWDSINNHLCEYDLFFSRSTKAGAAVSRRFYRSNNVGVAMSEYHRPPGADIVNVFVAVDIIDFAAGCTRYEDGIGSYRFKSADRAVHP